MRGGAVDCRAQVGAVVARLEQVEADRVVVQPDDDIRADLVTEVQTCALPIFARGRPERGRVEADDDGLVRAGAAGRVVVVVAGVLGQPVVGTRLGGHVDRESGGSGGGVVGGGGRGRNAGGDVGGRAQGGGLGGRLG